MIDRTTLIKIRKLSPQYKEDFEKGTDFVDSLSTARYYDSKKLDEFYALLTELVLDAQEQSNRDMLAKANEAKMKAEIEKMTPEEKENLPEHLKDKK